MQTTPTTTSLAGYRAMAGTRKLLAAQLLLVAVLVGALVGIHGGTAFANTATPYSDAGSPTSCDHHHDPDCASTQRSVSAADSGAATGLGNSDDDSPFENNSINETNPDPADDITTPQCLLWLCIPAP